MRLHFPSFPRLLLCLLLGVTNAGLARAQSNADLAAADAAFNEALQLMDAGDFAQACPKLEQSQKLAPASGTLLNLGDCYEQLARLPSAFRSFSKAAALAHETGKPERERVARQRADALRGRIALLTVVAPKSRPAGLEISVDGVSIPSSDWSSPYAVDPGTHTLDATAPGREPFRTTLPTVTGNTALTVEIPELRLLATSAPPKPEPARSTSPFDAQGVAALVSAGIGVGGVVAGSVFGLHSMSKHDESDRYCTGDTCHDPRGVEAMEDARAAGDRATLSFIIGGVGLGAGAVLWFARPFGPREQATLSVGVTPSALRVTGTW